MSMKSIFVKMTLKHNNFSVITSYSIHYTKLYEVIPDAHTAPLGTDVWRDTWLTLPAWHEGTTFRNIFTGVVLSTVTRDDRQVLPVGEILLHSPVAWLEKVA